MAPALFVALVVIAAGLRIAPSKIFTLDPPLAQNYAKHVYFTNFHAKTICESGEFWGYDPTYGAGIVTGSGWFIAYLFPAVMGCVTGWDAAVIIKLMLLTVFILWPMGAYLSARWLGLDRRQAILAGFLEFCITQFSFREQGIMSSMVGSSLGMSLVLPLTAGFRRLNQTEARPWVSAAVLAVTATLIFSLNPHASLVMVVCLSAVMWDRRRLLLNPKCVGILALAPLAVFGLVWPWTKPMMKYNASIAVFWDLLYPMVHLGWNALNRAATFLALLQPLHIFMVIPGYRNFRRPGPEHSQVVRMVFGIYLAIVAAVLLVVATGQGPKVFPMRYLDFAISLMTIPAAIRLLEVLRGQYGRRRLVTTVLGFVAALGLSMLVFRPWQQLRTEMPDNIARMMTWLDENTDDQSRLLIETTHNFSDDYPFDFAGLLPRLLPGREFVALPTTESPGVAHSTGLTEGILNWIPIASYSPERLDDYMRVYSVGWVVAFHDLSVQRLREQPELFEPREQFGAFHVFKVLRAPSYFLAGSGKVNAVADRISLTDLRPDKDGEVVLSYHLFSSLRTVSGEKLEGVSHPFDPMHWIKLTNPPDAVEIVNDVSLGFPDFAPDQNEYPPRVIEVLRKLGVRTDVADGTGIVVRRVPSQEDLPAPTW
ncbi:MAG: hypothetical protein H6683_10675 [Deltaproteobacteria bacterium]|nr:hypothetical protein [Deltaproteobacteria bacterium]